MCIVINNSLGFGIITGHMCQNLHAFKFWRCLDICIYCNFHTTLWCHGFLCICFKSQKKFFTYSNIFIKNILPSKSSNIEFSRLHLLINYSFEFRNGNINSMNSDILAWVFRHSTSILCAYWKLAIKH